MCVFGFKYSERREIGRLNEKSESPYRRKIQVRRIQLMTLRNVFGDVINETE